MKRRTGLSIRLFKLLVLCLITAASIAILSAPEEAAFLPIPLAAIIINFVVSGWIVILHKAIRLPSWEFYYRVSPHEKRIQEFCGIRYFKRLVNLPLYGALWGPSFRGSGAAVERMQSLLAEMRAAETAHLCGFFVGLGLFAYSLSKQWYHLAAWMLIFNVLINAYPVILQRYNRYRIQSFLARQNKVGS